MTKKHTISVIGLGYVGLPVACEFSKHYDVIGYDENPARITQLKQHIDITEEITSDTLKQLQITFTDDINEINKANIHIIAVPTPIDHAKQPDLTILRAATKSVANQLKQGDIIIYESTVYPGTTEEVCLPILESKSKLKCPEDFSIGYSPERINPGDKEHTFTKIKKVVSGIDNKTLETLAEVYGNVVTAGIHKASSIKVAEAAKIIENTQRDLNIALMNELAIIFNKMNIDTHEVLSAANTKWNFIPFTPGLVGGHCIGVDPYYLTYKAEQLNYHPQVILAGRRINDSMGKYIAEQTILKMIQQGVSIKDAKVCILGITFKENCPDIRNTKVIDIIRALKVYGVTITVCDPAADQAATYKKYKLQLQDWHTESLYDAIILAVPHSDYLEMSLEKFKRQLKTNGTLVDVKSALDKKSLDEVNITSWRL